MNNRKAFYDRYVTSALYNILNLNILGGSMCSGRVNH